MINYKLFKKHGLCPKKIKKNNNSFFLETNDNRKYLIKEKKEDLDNKFNYLLSRNFNYFPSYFTIDNYNVYDYIETADYSPEEKLYDIIDVISILHTKTTRYKNIDIDDYKIIYEDLDEKINYLIDYYGELNDLIDNDIYMSPSKYLLVLNISKVYNALSFTRKELDNWYELIKNNPKQRVSYIHNNLELDHLVRSDNPYLISWDKAKLDLPIFDLYDLYKRYYRITDFDILLNNYQKRYPLKEEELKLFFIKISIPFKIEFNDDEYTNTKKVKDLLYYIKQGDKLISPYYRKQNNN